MWSSKPFVRILFFFITGILIYRYLLSVVHIEFLYVLTALIISILVAVITVIFLKKRKYNWLKNLAIYACIITSALSISNYKNNTISNNDIPDSGFYIGVISENPVVSIKSTKAILKLNDYYTDSINQKKSMKVLCYFQPDTLKPKLKYGDVIVMLAKLAKPAKPMNPYEFDYGNYLLRNGIGYTAFVSSDKYSVVGYRPDNRIIAFAISIREKLLNSLRNNGVVGNNYEVAAAVLLGYDDTMEQDLKDDYIQAGAMHILCVSGLHVGIIYLVFNYLLGFFRSGRVNSFIKSIFLLLVIWSYATLTGLSPSVQRASVMISFFIIGNIIHRNRDTYNTLAASAFLLLAFNPYLLFNVGFQLSYAAVFGIISLHQPIYKLLYFKNTIIDSIWSITVLSISAQIATFPIAVYYFHFFPSWFWLTNLFTFPLSFLIIVTGLLFVLVSWLPLVSLLVGKLLAILVLALNTIVGLVKYFPASGIENIYFSFTMVCLIYLTIIIVYWLIKKQKPKLVLPLSFALLSVTILITIHNYKTTKQCRLIVYKVKQHSVYELIYGKEQIIFTDSVLIQNLKDIDYQIKNSRSVWGINEEAVCLPTNNNYLNGCIQASNDFLLFNNLSAFLYNKPLDYTSAKKKLNVDYVIVSGSHDPNFNKLTDLFTFDEVIIDNTVPPWQAKKIEKKCNDLHIKCYNVNQQGAFIVDL